MSRLSWIWIAMTRSKAVRVIRLDTLIEGVRRGNHFSRASWLRNIAGNNMVQSLLAAANSSCGVLGLTDHGDRHARIVSIVAHKTLVSLGFSGREAELAGVAGYLHDVGLAINRAQHAQIGALLAGWILNDARFGAEEIVQVIQAIGQHEELTGSPITPIGAAVIIADKTDLHHSRVTKTKQDHWDLHDRVNGAIRAAQIEFSAGLCLVRYRMDYKLASRQEFGEVFGRRVPICTRAADHLGLAFQVNVNKEYFNRDPGPCGEEV